MQKFKEVLEEARAEAAYKNYCEVRDAVFRMIEHAPKEDVLSKYWQGEVAGFDYMFDASPLIIKKLRHHCYHMTGLRDSDYRIHHAHMARRIEKKLKKLQECDRSGLFVPESPLLGGFGFFVNGALVNVDTLKFYESIIALDISGVLAQFKKSSSRKIILEIGAGWAGFAYQFKSLFPNTTYIIVDVPQSILFGGAYIKTVFPESKICFIEERKNTYKNFSVYDYDFIFIPHYCYEYLDFPHPDLVVNTVSFDQMTTGQVEGYVRKTKEWGVPALYSMNKDCWQNNDELGSVSEILGRYYKTRKIEVLPAQYTQFDEERKWYRTLANKCIELLRGRNRDTSPHAYKHTFGF